MNKLYRSLLLTSGLAAVLAGCGDDVTVTNPPPPPPVNPVHSITVGPDGGSVTIGATLTMVAAVNAEAGVATTVTWSSSDNARASVSSAGVVTGIAVGPVGIKACSTVNTSVCGVATVTVVAAPVATVTSVTVTPPAVSLVIGQAITATATVQGTNSPSQAVTWSSLASGIATVNASGVVTGVANGTAVIKATSNANSSIAGTMSVTVSTPQPASISIQSITTGTLGTPVTLSNVRGQIEITLNVDNGAFTILKAQALVNGTTVVAEQVFASSSAPAGPAAVPSTVVLSLNTRQVVKNTTGLFVPAIFNGPNTITARIFVVGVGQPISSNSIPVVMQNQDAMVAGTIPVLTPHALLPTVAANINSSTAWYRSAVDFVGGPNYIAFFPVLPTLNARSNNCGDSNSAAQGTPQAGLTVLGSFPCLSFTFEAGVSIGGWKVTPGTAPAADVVYIAAATSGGLLVEEAVGTKYTVDGTDRYNLFTTIGGTLNNGNSVAIDTKGPSTVANEIGFRAGCSATIPIPGCWIGTAYDINGDFSSTDNGTGVTSGQPAISNWVSTVLGVVTCGATPFSATLLAEDPSPTKYDACASATDNIGNVGNTVRGFNPFGVDKTNPTSLYSGTYVSDSTVKNAVPAGTINYLVNDNNSGLEATAVTLTLTELIAPHVASVCASGTTTLNPALDPAPAAGLPRAFAVPIASADNGCLDQGYYTWLATVQDRAGNSAAATLPVVLAIDRSAPLVQAVAPQPLFQAGQPATFLFFATDSTDLAGARLEARYQATGGALVDLGYTIRTGFGTKWDNVLTTITSPPTGFPAVIPGNQVFGSFVIDTTVALLGPAAALQQVNASAFDFLPASSAVTNVVIPAVYKDNTKFPVVGATNPWAATGIFPGSLFSIAGACTFTYDTPTNGPTIPVTVLIANQVAVGPPLVLDILSSIVTTGNGLGASDSPKLLSDNGVKRRYQYTVSAGTCAALQGAGTLRLIAVKNDGAGLPSAYLVP